MNNEKYKKITIRYRIALIYSLVEGVMLWFGLHSPVPALVIVVSVIMAFYKGIIASANMMFYKKQGVYHGHQNDDPDARANSWPEWLFMAFDIAAIIFCTRNTVVFIVIAAVYTILSLGILIYTQMEYERIRDIMDGFNLRFK